MELIFIMYLIGFMDVKCYFIYSWLKLKYTRKNSRTKLIYLKFTFVVANTRSEAVHVVCFSWPFDRPCGRSRSSEPRSFFKKTLLFFENQSVLQSPSQDILQKTPQIILKSTRGPERMAAGFFFQKKPLSLSKISPRSTNPLIFFAQTSSDFSQINIQANFNYIFFFSKKNVWPVARTPKD